MRRFHFSFELGSLGSGPFGPYPDLRQSGEPVEISAATVSAAVELFEAFVGAVLPSYRVQRLEIVEVAL